MPVTILDAWTGTGDFPTDGLSLAPSAGSNRVGWVFCSHEMNGGGGMSMGTVTWGDQTVTEVHDFVVGSTTAYHNLNYVGYITEAQIAAMSGSALSFTFTNGNGGVGPFGNAKAYAATYQDVDQANIVSASNSASNTSTSSLAPGAIDVDVDEKVIAFVVAGQPNAVAPGTGYTEESAFTGPSNDHASGAMHRTATTNDDTHNVAHTCSASTRMAVSNVSMGFAADIEQVVEATATVAADIWRRMYEGPEATAVGSAVFSPTAFLQRLLESTAVGAATVASFATKFWMAAATAVGVASLETKKLASQAIETVVAVVAEVERGLLALRELAASGTGAVVVATKKLASRLLEAVAAAVAVVDELFVPGGFEQAIEAVAAGVARLNVGFHKALEAIASALATVGRRLGAKRLLEASANCVPLVLRASAGVKEIMAVAVGVIQRQVHVYKYNDVVAVAVARLQRRTRKILQALASAVALVTKIVPALTQLIEAVATAVGTVLRPSLLRNIRAVSEGIVTRQLLIAKFLSAVSAGVAFLSAGATQVVIAATALGVAVTTRILNAHHVVAAMAVGIATALFARVKVISASALAIASRGGVQLGKSLKATAIVQACYTFTGFRDRAVQCSTAFEEKDE